MESETKLNKVNSLPQHKFVEVKWKEEKKEGEIKILKKKKKSNHVLHKLNIYKKKKLIKYS